MYCDTQCITILDTDATDATDACDTCDELYRHIACFICEICEICVPKMILAHKCKNSFTSRAPMSNASA